MALITSDCDAIRFNEYQMALITSDCDATRFNEYQMALITSECAFVGLPQRDGRRPVQRLDRREQGLDLHPVRPTRPLKLSARVDLKR